jgi:hypothetical protein
VPGRSWSWPQRHKTPLGSDVPDGVRPGGRGGLAFVDAGVYLVEQVGVVEL